MLKINLPKSLYYSLILFSLALAFQNFANFEQDYDLWMHLFFGKVILEQGIPYVDHFSFTANGLAMTDHEWLSQVILYTFYSSLGDAGIIIFKLVFFLALLILAWSLIKRKVDSKFGLFLTFALFILVLRPGVAFRIQMFSYFFLMLIIFLENTDWKASLKKWIYPVLFLFWSNLHGAFVLGLGVLGVYSLSPKKILLVLLCTLVTLVNPYGFGLWEYIFYELTVTKSQEFITEWQPFNFEAREMAFLAMLVISWLGCLLRPKSVSLPTWILLLVASYLGITAVRHSPLLAILGLPALCAALKNVFQVSVESQSDNLISKTLAGAVASLALVLIFMSWPQSFSLSSKREPLPIKAMNFVEEKNLKGNVMVPLHWGGYTLFRAAPNLKVNIDGRWAMVYQPELMELSHEFSYFSTSGKWKEIAKSRGATLILVENTHPALSEMLGDTEVQVLFKSEISTLLQI